MERRFFPLRLRQPVVGMEASGGLPEESRILANNGITVERVCAVNVRQLKHLHVCFFPVPYPQSFYDKASRGAIDAHLLKCSGGDYVGCVSWHMDKDGKEDDAELLTLGVKVLFRRRGLGRALLEIAVRGAAEAGARRIR